MNNRCLKIEGLIERFFDGETTRKENREIQRHIKVCENCRKLVYQNQDITDFFKNLPELECPETVLNTINNFAQVKRVPKREKLIDLHILFNWKSAVVGIAFSTAIIFLIIRPYSNQMPADRPYPVYKQKDIEKAKIEALWSLGFIGNKMRKSEIKAVKEVFYKSLPETIKKSLEQSVPILFGGKK